MWVTYLPSHDKNATMTNQVIAGCIGLKFGEDEV